MPNAIGIGITVGFFLLVLIVILKVRKSILNDKNRKKRKMSHLPVKTVLYIASSLDNYIAKPDGNLDWLTSFPQPKTGDYGYKALLNNTETIVMGRNTYEELIAAVDDWPYAIFFTYIITSNPYFEVKTPNTFVVSNNFPKFIENIKIRSSKNCWIVGGGQLISEFLNQDLIDTMIISMVPIILGDGIPLFPNKPNESNWKLVNVEKFDTGLINLTYKKLT